MKLSPSRCPTCGDLASSTVDKIFAHANIEHFGGSVFENTGETEVIWDTQENISQKRDKVTVVCANHHEWEASTL